MIIVFGSNGVLGKEICNQLITKNQQLFLTANNGFKKIKDSYTNIENVVHIKKCNIAEKNDIEEIFNYVKEENINITGVVNNFAYTYDSSITYHDPNSEEVKHLFNVNYHGVSQIFESLVAYVNKDIDTTIRVVNVLSNSLKTHNASNYHYISSKAAVETLATFFAKNYSENLSINNVCPGLMKSDITSSRFDEVVNHIESLTPLKRLASPTEVAQLIAYFCSESPLSICGQTIFVDGGRTL